MKIDTVANNARALGWSVKMDRKAGTAIITPRVFNPYSDRYRETFQVTFDDAGNLTGSTEVRTMIRTGEYSEPILSNLYELKMRREQRA